MRDDFLRGAAAVLTALSDPAVAAAWDRPSVLADQTVGSLAGHLARGGVWVVDDYLDLDPPPAATFASTADYCAQIAGLGAADHQAIRDRGAALAAEGPEAVVARLSERLPALDQRLRTEPADRLLPVFGGGMALDAYLGTRLVEQVVHLDDLARSVPDRRRGCLTTWSPGWRGSGRPSPWPATVPPPCCATSSAPTSATPRWCPCSSRRRSRTTR